MYSEKTVLPLITQIKAIFEQEIVDFALMDLEGIRYSYTDFLVENMLTVMGTVQEVISTKKHYQTIHVKEYAGLVFYDGKASLLVVLFDDPTRLEETSFDDIYRRLLDVSFFSNHLDIYFEQNQDHEYGMLNVELDGRVRVMNQYAHDIFHQKVEHINELEKIIKDSRAFFMSYTNAIEKKTSVNFSIDTVFNQRYQVNLMIDEQQQLVQLVFSLQPISSFYSGILDSLNHLRLGVVHFELLYNDKGLAYDARVLYSNERYGKMMEIDIRDRIGKTIYDIYPEYPKARFLRYAHVAETNSKNAFDYYSRRIDKYFHIYSYSPKKGEFVNVYYETTQYQRLKTKERTQLKKVQMMLKLAAMGFFEINVKAKTIETDDYVKNIFGVKEIDYALYRKLFKERLHEDDRDRIFRENAKLMNGEINEGSSVFKMVPSNKTDPIYIEYYLQSIEHDNENRPHKILGLLRDVTKEYERNKKIEDIAHHDSLTGLHNRRDLARRVDQNLLPLPATLAFFDLDGLKSINDIYGHYEGDKCIQAFADLLKDVYHDCYVARVGGDEFVVVMGSDVRNVKTRENVLRKRLSKEVSIDLPMGVSIGYAKHNQEVNYRKAFDLAEDEMYREKLFARPRRKELTLELLMRVVFHHEPRLKPRIKRMQALADDFMRALGFIRGEDMRTMESIVYYHAVGRVHDYTQMNKTNKNHEKDMYYKELHLETAFKILTNLLSREDIAKAVLYQNEYYNGQGEPHQLKGEEIPYYARLLAIVKRYDQLARCRVYGKNISSEDALNVIQKETPERFDPTMVEIFVKLIKEN